MVKTPFPFEKPTIPAPASEDERLLTEWLAGRKWGKIKEEREK